ncbi:hypothetical protein [Streptomyces fuscigenes]|uniref:hypothetical protein n=1 Tax=Streptomyces fuscigenes TaxID=1528880 RepID=UPI001F483153|nr:hypothetical protein [Streptomyces fuscigenes]MCF3960128.1 hypothetical protein [Streptomyces fuscigenes]
MDRSQPRLNGTAQAGPGMKSADGFLEALVRSDLPPLRGDRHTGQDFRANVVTRDLGPLHLTELVTPEGECFRDARSARAQDSELWQIEVVTRGHVRAEQGGSTPPYWAPRTWSSLTRYGRCGSPVPRPPT